MSQAILEHVSSSSLKRIPVLKPGYVVRVHQKIQEGGKTRTQIFEGLVIKISSGSGINKTFTVRKIVEGIGVEKLFPFHSPNIDQIDVVKKGKVRRSKLYYMRDRSGKSARLRDRDLGEIIMTGADEVVEEPEVEEAPEAEAPAQETPVEEPKEEEAPKTDEAVPAEPEPEAEKEEKKEEAAE